MFVRRVLPIVLVCLLSASARASSPDPTEAPILAAVPVAGQMPALRPPASLSPAACGPGFAPCPASAPGRRLLVGAAGAGLLAGSVALGVGAGNALPSWYFQAHGRPDPLVSTLGLGVGLAVTVAASQLLVPLAAPLGDDAQYAVAVADARRASWRSSRWAVLAGGVGLAAVAAGASMERREFGSGQALMGAGGATLLLSGAVYLGLELAGVLQASQQARRARP